MEKSERMRAFQRSCARVDRQVEEIQENLASKVKRVAEKNERLKQLSSNRGQSFQDIVEREDQLNEYAQSIMERITLLKVGKERIRKHAESMRFHLDAEISENQRQLELLTKRQKMLAETRRILSEENVKLYQAILEKSSRVKTLAEQQDMTMTEIYNMSLRESSLMIGTDETSITALRDDIEQIEEAISATQSSIVELDRTKSELTMKSQSMNSEMFRIQRRLKSAELEYTESVGELTGEIQEQAEKQRSILKKQKDRNMKSQSIQSQNETSIEGIKSNESELLHFRKLIKSRKRKVAKLREAVSKIKEERKRVEGKTEAIRKERKEREHDRANNKARMQELSEERAQIKSDWIDIRNEMEKASKQSDIDSRDVEEQEKMARSLCKVYEMIDFAKQREDALKQALARVKNERMQPVSVDNEQEVAEMRKKCKWRTKKHQKNLQEVKEDVALIQQQLVTVEVEMKSPKDEVARLREGVEKVFLSFKDICRSGDKPTLAEITEFLTEEPKRRKKDLKKLQKNVSSLSDKVDEKKNRIEDIRERISQKKERFSRDERTLNQIKRVQDTYETFKSLLQASRSEKSAWMSLVGEEIPVLLKRWEAELKSFSPELSKL